VSSSRGTVSYEERGQGYRDVEKVGKHWYIWTFRICTIAVVPSAHFFYPTCNDMVLISDRTFFLFLYEATITEPFTLILSKTSFFQSESKKVELFQQVVAYPHFSNIVQAVPNDKVLACPLKRGQILSQ
jgi:hypothetical protein